MNSVDKDQFDASALELTLAQTIAENLYGRHRHDNAAIIALRYLADVENDMESVELWKKNYENFLKSAPLRADGIDGKNAEAESITSANDAALLNWQKSGEEVFKRFVQNQMELCHFFGRRCEQHLKLPSRTRSAAH